MNLKRLVMLFAVFLSACAAQPPTPQPVTIETRTLEMVGGLCQTNDPAWQDASTAGWLAQNVGGNLEHWSFKDGVWTYAVGPEEVGLSWTYTPSYKSGFRYPGFGSFRVQVFEGDQVTVDATNADQFPQLQFTRLELMCP